jgi:hypothetical protein
MKGSVLTMLSISKNAKKYILVAIGTASILLSGYYFYNYQQLKNERFEPQEVTKQDSKIKITPNTDLVQKIMYTKCGDEETLHTKPPENLIGLNYNQVQKVYPGWNIEKFDTNEILLTIRIDSFCREHANNMFVGIKDGYVAIYYGKPGAKAILKELTKIPVAKIMQQDREELKQGLPVQSREELLRTLEGLQSR